MTEQAPEQKKGSSCSRILGWILRMLFVIILGIVLGVVIYFGATTLYQNYVTSVQTNTQQIGSIDQRLQQAEDLIKQQFTDTEVRLKALEQNSDQRQSDQQALQTQSAGLGELQKAQSTAQAALDRLQVQSTAMASQVADSASRLPALETVVAAQQSQIAQLALDQQTLQVVQLLSRARSNLVEGNLGLARQDVQSAYDALLSFPTEAKTPESEAALTYLQTALDNLPLKPVAAADAVDSAWSLLLTGAATPVSTPEAAGTPTPTLTTTVSAPAATAIATEITSTAYPAP